VGRACLEGERACAAARRIGDQEHVLAQRGLLAHPLQRRLGLGVARDQRIAAKRRRRWQQQRVGRGGYRERHAAYQIGCTLAGPAVLRRRRRASNRRRNG
jgi:hypothetical protein